MCVQDALKILQWLKACSAGGCGSDAEQGRVCYSSLVQISIMSIFVRSRFGGFRSTQCSRYALAHADIPVGTRTKLNAVLQASRGLRNHVRKRCLFKKTV